MCSARGPSSTRPATQAAEIRGSTNVDHLAVEPDSTPAPASSPQS